MIDFSKKDLLFLAPLAGFTDLPFRRVVKKFGADVTISEMISSNALVHSSKKTYKMLERADNESPYIVQIAGSSEEVIKDAVLILNDMEGIDGIDLNCGCPVPKVVRQGAGSALLNDLPQMAKIIETIKKYSNKRYTSVKARLGFNKKNAKEIAKVASESGADFITFHARTRSDAYKKERIDYEEIKRAKEAASIPVVANGDIDTLEKYEYVKNFTGADAIMLGRGAVGNPWIFYQIKNRLKYLEKESVGKIVLEHFDSMVDFYGEKAVPLFRKHIHSYSKNFPNATIFRDKINRVEEVEAAREYIIEFFNA